jgi:hypothetical protein
MPGCKGSKGGLFLIVGVVAEHTVLPEEAVHTTFSVNNFFGSRCRKDGCQTKFRR